MMVYLSEKSQGPAKETKIAMDKHNLLPTERKRKKGVKLIILNHRKVYCLCSVGFKK